MIAHLLSKTPLRSKSMFNNLKKASDSFALKLKFNQIKKASKIN